MKDFELLKSLYCIHSKSGNEKKMRKFIKRWILNNVDNVNVWSDSTGNLFAVKGFADEYPCICSHIDQVQNLHSNDFVAIETDDIIFGYSPKMRCYQGLGADDKNGIWVALMCLQKFDVLKCAFFVGEEIGCVGSRACDLSFFDDCRFCLQCDRRDFGDLITEISGEMCSDEFLEDINYKHFGYQPTQGLCTDVGELRDRGILCSCINISCGYYNPHTDEEFTVKKDLENCLDFVEYIIEFCTNSYPFETPTYYYGKYSFDDYDTYYMSEDDKRDWEMYDAKEEMFSLVDSGDIYDKDSFCRFVADYDGIWGSLKQSDFDSLWSICQDYIGSYLEYEDKAV